MVLADSPLACIRCASAVFDLSSAFGRPMDCPRARRASRAAAARSTLDTYGHLWPDADESTRSAIGAVIAKPMDSAESAADPLRTERPRAQRRRRSAR